MWFAYPLSNNHFILLHIIYLTIKCFIIVHFSYPCVSCIILLSLLVSSRRAHTLLITVVATPSDVVSSSNFSSATWTTPWVTAVSSLAAIFAVLMYMTIFSTLEAHSFTSIDHQSIVSTTIIFIFLNFHFRHLNFIFYIITSLIVLFQCIN